MLGRGHKVFFVEGRRQEVLLGKLLFRKEDILRIVHAFFKNHQVA